VLAGYDYVYDAFSRITSINSTVEGLSTFTVLVYRPQSDLGDLLAVGLG
jgi:hypothetical protein